MTSRTGDVAGQGAARGRRAAWPSQLPAAGWKDVLWRVYGEIGQDRVMLIAAGVTYYLLLALVPALSALVSVYGLFADPATVQEHAAMLQSVIPGGGMEIINEQLTRLAEQGTTTLGLTFAISLAIALWSANAGMKSLFEAMNVAYDEAEKRSFVKLTAVSFVFTLGAIVAVILFIGLVVGLPLVLGFLGLGSGTQWLVSLASYAALFALVFLGIGALYHWGPSRTRAKWRWITPGTVLTVVVIAAVSVLFSWYVANFGSYNATYGSLGALIGFMTWIWISTIILIVGGELNAEMEHQTIRDTTHAPAQPMGARGATMADTIGKASGADAAPELPNRRDDVQRLLDRRRGSSKVLAMALPTALFVTWILRNRDR
ncbi:YihY/virulence factor BrkB family protein [Aurantimonas sp. A2-1-M11]|uniref:YihY/virulence factor BrkB family protein n=1 Tax=Aurantimonas sp. A2-1-M11 TaxID=3113712 RepID=UPI002F95A026